ncbi:double-stranded RNA-specific editase Adar-like isoform X3 [Dinothrombium tinctorium]|uniref:Double-stranded RNA-specific editase Adar-like isoform X3 n=1 Tax=Dinothrombium tinctorium TaxID=1965070 RepID=A0A3S3P486_9ACAR|nr:double-stranded RNA-specific editase Adar-like isoform X3 [Dinothrombium tinctorium]RWS07726.1 double-stranded RNA-specific editase Adar-like isoform X3 [Dinothrombium tinctorium]RWS07807.1 double-stranded RNA-specific editase Adar-like isoform X3 [Dinothrombium tinctorium]
MYENPIQALTSQFREPNAVRFVEEGRRGPPHNPTYRISCHLLGNVFFGHGRSKQTAKQDAAKNALDYISQIQKSGFHYHPRFVPTHAIRPSNPVSVHFNSDSFSSTDFNSPSHSLSFNSPQYSNHHFGLRSEKHKLLLADPSAPYSPSKRGRTIEFENFIDKTDSTQSRDDSVSANINVKSEFASDDLEVMSDFIKFDEAPKSSEQCTETEKEIRTKKAKERITLRIMTDKPMEQNPIALIHELNPDASWQFLKAENIGKLTTKFTMQLTVNNSNFIGKGRTKKLAKMDAAKIALLELYNINLMNYVNPQVIIRREEDLLLNQDIANAIGNSVLLKSKEIFELCKELKKWSVLAAIVLTDEDRPQWFDIICITSGTKCVKGDNLSMLGHVINDCHAEILARRCFLLHLYRQINSFLDDKDKPEIIIEPCENSGGFRLKSNIKVHLFISTSPCGDARVFSPKEESAIDAHPNRLSRGLLRAKIESGEGTIPVKKEASTLTWDGILQGQQRIQFMSCSDKIALWNLVGLQGSLLSHIIEPVYLESVVIGSLFNYEHLVRAINGRLNLNFESDSMRDLPPSFKLNKAKVAKAILKEINDQRQVQKAPSYAINWIKGDTRLEIINCDTGKLQDGSASRLSKRFLFLQFCNLLGRNASTLSSSNLNSYIPVVYRDAKTSSFLYQKCKTQAIQAFMEQNLGTWIQVPNEIDLFSL